MTGVYLTQHENRTFESQTIIVSGNAFLRCTFIHCTLVLTNVAAMLSGCHFVRCNWHLDYLVLWGDPTGRQTLRRLLEQMDGDEPITFSTN